MGFLNLGELLIEWGLEKVTKTQVIGQILQWAIQSDELLVALDARTKNSNKRLDAIEKRLNIIKPQ